MSANMCMHIHMFFWARTAQSIVFLQCQLRGGGVSSKTFRCRRAHRRPCPLPPPPGRPPPSPSHIRALIHPYPVPLCKTIPLDPLSRVRLYIPLYPMKLKVARAVGCVDTVMYREGGGWVARPVRPRMRCVPRLKTRRAVGLFSHLPGCICARSGRTAHP